MTWQGTIRHYGIQQLVLLHYHLNDYFRTEDAEALHQARLMYKRYSAWISYLTLSGIDTDDIREHSKALRRVFRRIGRDRDLHVQITLCSQLNSEAAKEFRSSLQRSLARSCAIDLEQDEPLKEIEKSIRRIKKICARIEPSSNASGFGTVMQRKMDYIRDLFSGAGSDLDYHRLRRLIKEAWYFLEMAGRLSDEKEGWALVGDRLKLAEQRLGIWHDAAMLLESCARFILLAPPENLDRNQELLLEIKQMKKDQMSAFLDGSGQIFRMP